MPGNPPDNQGSSTRPYLLRALHDWCTDNGFTPYVAVFVGPGVQVPVVMWMTWNDRWKQNCALVRADGGIFPEGDEKATQIFAHFDARKWEQSVAGRGALCAMRDNVVCDPWAKERKSTLRLVKS